MVPEARRLCDAGRLQARMGNNTEAFRGLSTWIKYKQISHRTKDKHREKKYWQKALLLFLEFTFFFHLPERLWDLHIVLLEQSDFSLFRF